MEALSLFEKKAVRRSSEPETSSALSMPRVLLRACLPALIALASINAANASAQTTLVVLVRHAERESTGDDPGLSATGQERARALVRATAHAGISAIYHTAYRRTAETARAVADHLKLEPVVLGPRDGQSVPQHAAEVAAEIMAKHSGKTVLVVGHSNTVPAIISALGVSEAPAIADPEYDHFFVVVLAPGHPARLMHSRYGT